MRGRAEARERIGERGRRRRRAAGRRRRGREARKVGEGVDRGGAAGRGGGLDAHRIAADLQLVAGLDEGLLPLPSGRPLTEIGLLPRSMIA
jgi:hypothetical protein